MSTINTNGLNVNYPVPGVNNNSQGFRNNFTNIKQNLDIAANELTDLQDSVVLKNPLGNAAINNDMANVLIANASTLGFRATTYNLGGDLIGTVTIDLGIADVHYGTLGGDILLTFGNWAPTGTLSKVTLILSTSNVPNNYTISFPGEVIISSDDFGTTLLNNYETVGVTPTLTFPHGCTELILECYSTDCGDSIYITPINRPYQSVQIQTRTPPSTGDYGDVNGTVCVDPAVTQLTITSSLANDFFYTDNTSTLYTGMPIIFTGTSFETNITAGTTYYVGNIANSTYFTVSANANASGNVNLTGSSGTMYLNPVSYLYIATGSFDNESVTNVNISNTSSPSTITLNSTADVFVNNPIIFTSAEGTTSNIGVVVGEVYYVKSIASNNITISKTRNNGLAGPTFTGIITVTDSANVDVDANVYYGSDIFRRIPLQPF